MNLIFDFDGTICDSIKTSVKTVNVILKKYSYKTTTFSEVQRIGLKGLLISRQVVASDVEKIISDYRELMRKNYNKLKLVPNLKAVLDILKTNNELGILTTNEVANVQKFLNLENIDCFKFIRSEKNVFEKGKGLKSILNDFKFDPGETYYIGDETRDIEASKDAGVKSISVSWGAESSKLLENSKPFLIVNKPEELLYLH